MHVYLTCKSSAHPPKAWTQRVSGGNGKTLPGATAVEKPICACFYFQTQGRMEAETGNKAEAAEQSRWGRKADKCQLRASRFPGPWGHKAPGPLAGSQLKPQSLCCGTSLPNALPSRPLCMEARLLFQMSLNVSLFNSNASGTVFCFHIISLRL